MRVSWPVFKAHLAKGLLPQIIKDTDGEYGLIAFDGPMILECTLNKASDSDVTVKPADTVEFETTVKASCNQPLYQYVSPAFSAKQYGSKKLFRRVHGIFSDEIPAGQSGTVSITIPYNMCKITKLFMANSQFGDTADLKVYDTPTAAIQASMGVPAPYRVASKMLNQFGFDVCLPSGVIFSDESQYDADLIKDMKVEITYKNNGDAPRKVGVNFVLHELK